MNKKIERGVRKLLFYSVIGQITPTGCITKPLIWIWLIMSWTSFFGLGCGIDYKTNSVCKYCTPCKYDILPTFNREYEEGYIISDNEAQTNRNWVHITEDVLGDMIFDSWNNELFTRRFIMWTSLFLFFIFPSYYIQYKVLSESNKNKRVILKGIRFLFNIIFIVIIPSIQWYQGWFYPSVFSIPPFVYN